MHVPFINSVMAHCLQEILFLKYLFKFYFNLLDGFQSPTTELLSEDTNNTL